MAYSKPTNFPFIYDRLIHVVRTSGAPFASSIASRAARSRVLFVCLDRCCSAAALPRDVSVDDEICCGYQNLVDALESFLCLLSLFFPLYVQAAIKKELKRVGVGGSRRKERRRRLPRGMSERTIFFPLQGSKMNRNSEGKKKKNQTKPNQPKSSPSGAKASAKKKSS